MPWWGAWTTVGLLILLALSIEYGIWREAKRRKLEGR